ALFLVDGAGIADGRPPAGRLVCAGVVLSGQVPAGEWAPDEEAQALVLAHGQEFVLGLAGDQAVVGLHAGEAAQVALLGCPEGFHRLPRGEVGASDVAHLALPYEVGERAEALVP